MRIRRVGDAALLVDLAGEETASTVEAWRSDLWNRRAAGEFVAVDIVPGACTVLLDGVQDVAAVAARLPGWAPPAASAPAPGPLVEIPIRYDGPDLAAVAVHWQVSVESVIARHMDTEFHVAFCGFAPGFAYMTGLAAELALPRLDTPRTRVPPGSVALADIYCGIYPRESPGGWQLIGRTEAVLFDPEREPPVLLGPGTRVRFSAVVA
ncbi:MAG TPA: allophanate hydrolase subunit 1 [Micromonosporaceae bacterium]|jgi:KipI family sensor histidine kinase inhibitor|nr:allophanate hydrolase subunit 1 [Micromonosporaceae bacterium]